MDSPDVFSVFAANRDVHEPARDVLPGSRYSLSIVNVIAGVDNFMADNIKAEIVDYIEKNEIGIGAVMNALRLVLVGGGFGPDLMKIAELLGKEEVIKRIEAGIENIQIYGLQNSQ